MMYQGEEDAMSSDEHTWQLIHAERTRLADMLEGLTPEQWAAPSLVKGWNVHLAAAHIMKSGEQTLAMFLSGLVKSGFRFNVMIDRDLHEVGRLSPPEIIARLRARTTTTNKPPAPTVAMLGEVVIHGYDIRFPLGIADDSAGEARMACLEMFKASTFPVPSKKRIAGLKLNATDATWSTGTGPEVHGPVQSLLLAMTGRPAGLAALSGEGVATLRGRIAT